MKFPGYERPDGCAGIRNHVLIIPGGLLAAKICDFVEGTKTILTADSGSGWTGRNLLSTSTAVVALLMWTTANPNTQIYLRDSPF
ncbi:MAG: hypothetical protein GTO13_12075 [Proteobacteria bacterium]|nr:hypothetical protein [Pseudomonadota bacterium]